MGGFHLTGWLGALLRPHYPPRWVARAAVALIAALVALIGGGIGCLLAPQCRIGT